jgi:signal transduction histidine kinase
MWAVGSKRMVFRLGIALAWLLCGAGPASAATAPAAADRLSSPVVLTQAAALRALSPMEAASRRPVKLRATVIGLNPLSPAIFLQDETGGTFVRQEGVWPEQVRLGDVLEVEGVSYEGRFVPGVQSARLRVVGHGELPEARAVTFDDLLSTRHHYERVELSGIVRSVAPGPVEGQTVLTLAAGTRKLEVRLVGVAPHELPALVDARVTVAGVAAGYINDARQMVAPQLHLSRLQDLRVDSPPPADPWQAPLETAASLCTFKPEGVSGHRVRLRGVVTHAEPGKTLFLREGQRGLRVETSQADSVAPGDEVEVLGFPAMGTFSACIEHAEFRVMGRGAPPEPVAVTVGEAMRGTNDANLVSVRARLLEILNTPDETLLVLSAEETALRARLPRTRLPFRKETELQVTGICRLGEPKVPHTMFGVTPGTLELLARSAQDLQVESRPSWWTPGRLMVAAGLAVGLAAVALVRVVLLRRRVAEQSEVIRQKIQREAALEERQRLAREIHDTVAQSFSGLGFQLEAVSARLPAAAEEARRQVETARQIVRHGQESLRRSLMNLRAQELERGRLADALPEMARQLATGTGIDVRCTVEGPAQGLPDAIESNLLRIGQECLTNAVRHGKPKRIGLEIRYAAEAVQVRIQDDGTGFDPGQLKRGGSGHFGWRGIWERAEQIRARVDLATAPGQGTTVTVTAPL